MGFSPSNPSVKLKTNTEELIGMTTLTETVNADFYLSWLHLSFIRFHCCQPFHLDLGYFYLFYELWLIQVYEQQTCFEKVYSVQNTQLYLTLYAAN